MMAGNSVILSQNITGIILWCMAVACLYIVAVGGVEERSTLRCHQRYYRIYAEQSDVKGRKCSDTVEIKSCWGRCESNEISDWQFPYKRSHHPVCVHGGRRWSSTRLKNCQPGVAPDTDLYHYLEATNCRCQTCSSEDTSCEWLPADVNELELFPQSNKLSSEQLEDDD